VKNNKFKSIENPDNYSGLGISNTKQRLELLYPSNYSLHINENKTEYHVSLKITLL
jgi:sensor histidine kinase YesM